MPHQFKYLNPMLILASDTSTPLGSVAIIQLDTHSGQHRLLAESHWEKKESHSELIITETEKLLSKNNLPLSQLDAFACGLGPGSFTGIRVALSFIKSLAYSFQKPVYVMNSLKLMALPYLQNQEEVITQQEAFRDLHYFAHYKSENEEYQEVLPPSAWTMDQMEKYNTDQTFVLKSRPKASDFQYAQLHRAPKSEILQWFQVEALYVRASEAEEKLWKGGSFKSDRQRGERS